MKNDNVQCKTDNTKDKAQENHVKMTQTPVPSLILRLSCSTIVSMLAGTTYNIVDMYFVFESWKQCGCGSWDFVFGACHDTGGRVYIWHGCRQQDIQVLRGAERERRRAEMRLLLS